MRDQGDVLSFSNWNPCSSAVAVVVSIGQAPEGRIRVVNVRVFADVDRVALERSCNRTRTTAVGIPHKKPLPKLAMDRFRPSFPGVSLAVVMEVELMAEENPELPPLLIDVQQQIARIFGPDVPLVLNVVRNPKDVDSLPELVVSIQTGLSVGDARTKLARLDDEWWLDALPRGNRRLTIAIEYIVQVGPFEDTSPGRWKKFLEASAATRASGGATITIPRRERRALPFART